MGTSLLGLQRLLELGSSISKEDRLAISRGFTNNNEYSRYHRWRKSSGKTTSLEANDFLSDLEWWRFHIDYKTASVFMEYARKYGYSITQENLDRFQQWKIYKCLSHSNSEEYLELYVEWVNTHSERKVVKASMSAGSRRDAIAISLGFENYKQRSAYDKACRKLGFTYRSDSDRYLNGIEEWLRQRRDPKNQGRHSRHSLKVSDFFSIEKEQSYFTGWCARSGIIVHLLNDNELKDAVRLYKKERSYLERKRALPFKNNSQKERYTRYCKIHGFSFKENPDRYLAEFQNWSDNIDNGPRV